MGVLTYYLYAPGWFSQIRRPFRGLPRVQPGVFSTSRVHGTWFHPGEGSRRSPEMTGIAAGSRVTSCAQLKSLGSGEVQLHIPDMDASPTDPLAKRRCIPCEGGIPKLDEGSANNLLRQLNGNWAIVDGHHLQRDYRFDDFVTALAFVNQVGALAEENGHHPDLFLAYGQVGVTIWTHAVDGLTESDFILAAKIDELKR